MIAGPAAVTIFSFFIFVGQALAFGPHSAVKTSESVNLPRGIPAYQNFTSPVSYQSFTRRDVIDLIQEGEVIEVEGISAKTRIFLPLGFLFGLSPTTGLSFDVMDRSLKKAVAEMQERYQVRALYDVRIDKHLFSILGIYSRTTTLIHAKGIR